jgi:hypothetical protein
VRTFRECTLWMLLGLAACGASDEVSPPSGSAALKYVATLESLEGVKVVLENGTARPIYFRGDPDPAPGSLTMVCSSRDGADGFSQGLSENMRALERIEVAPHQRVQMTLWVPLPVNFKSGRRNCRLRLTLDSGTVLESREFIP